MTTQEVQSIATKFINDNDGKSLEAEDPSALDQCMDAIFKYLDALGIDRASIRHQYAYQVWANPTDLTRKYFDLLPNTPTFIPQFGDIAVFGITSGIPVGHISLVEKGTTLINLISFDQNWDTIHYYHTDSQGNHIPYCRTVLHSNYYGCVGFLRPKTSTSAVNYDAILNQIRDIINSGGDSKVRFDKIKDLINKV